MRISKQLGLALFLAFVLALGAGCAKKTQVQTPQQADKTTTVVEQAPAEATGDDMTKEAELAAAMDKATMVVTGNLVYFDFDKFEIKPEYRGLLKDKAAVLKKYPQMRVLVAGHCDNRGTEEYNLALGERRARTVKEYLMVLGVSASQLEVVSYGEERPAVEGSTEAAWAKNRRAVFTIIK